MYKLYIFLYTVYTYIELFFYIQLTFLIVNFKVQDTKKHWNIN